MCSSDLLCQQDRPHEDVPKHGRERNAAVLRNVLMWSILLAKGEPQIGIDLGGQELELQTVPSHTEMKVGLATDSIRLDTLIGGAGGGEFVVDEGDAELDAVAAFEIAGMLIEERSEVEASADGSDDDVGPDQGTESIP